MRKVILSLDVVKGLLQQETCKEQVAIGFSLSIIDLGGLIAGVLASDTGRVAVHFLHN